MSTSSLSTSVPTTQKSTEHLSTDATTSDYDDSKDESWIILVAALPIIGGLIFLVALGFWYNRRKKAQVMFVKGRLIILYGFIYMYI